jgi:DNA-directed RNA polymerase subunit RPC12/RpoP
MPAACPDCRSQVLRRRRRTGVLRYFAGILRQWPYQCEQCGSNFLLRKRYLEPAKGNEARLKEGESERG